MDWLAAEMLKHDVKPEIEAFDLSHIFQAKKMADDERLAGTPYVQFVMGVKNAMPADRDVFDYYIHTAKRLFGEDAPWCAAGIGPSQIVLNEWAIAAGVVEACQGDLTGAGNPDDPHVFKRAHPAPRSSATLHRQRQELRPLPD